MVGERGFEPPTPWSRTGSEDFSGFGETEIWEVVWNQELADISLRRRFKEIEDAPFAAYCSASEQGGRFAVLPTQPTGRKVMYCPNNSRGHSIPILASTVMQDEIQSVHVVAAFEHANPNHSVAPRRHAKPLIPSIVSIVPSPSGCTILTDLSRVFFRATGFSRRTVRYHDKSWTNMIHQLRTKTRFTPMMRRKQDVRILTCRAKLNILQEFIPRDFFIVTRNYNLDAKIFKDRDNTMIIEVIRIAAVRNKE